MCLLYGKLAVQVVFYKLEPKYVALNLAGDSPFNISRGSLESCGRLIVFQLFEGKVIKNTNLKSSFKDNSVKYHDLFSRVTQQKYKYFSAKNAIDRSRNNQNMFGCNIRLLLPC